MYQSIYRRYRPQTFTQLYGQDSISITLTNAIINDRIAHAYLFSGPRGTGKTTSAKLVAKALNCSNIVDGNICDECENCLLIKRNQHPDVIEIDAASNNGVDEVRDLIERVKFSPLKGQKKVYIIDEVHMMSQGAFNALLKTLEEPPEHVVFILATTESHKVIATIKSRCQKFVFKKISNDNIKACLVSILEQEGATYDDESLEVIATLSDGGMRDALSILEQVMIFSNNIINIDNVNLALDLVDYKKIQELYTLVINKKMNESLNFVNELAKQSVDFKQVISAIIKLSMDELIQSKTEQNNDISTKFILNMIEIFDDSLNKIKFDNSKKLYLDLAIIKCINFKEQAYQMTGQTQVPSNAQTPKQLETQVQNNVEKNKQTISFISHDDLLNVLVQARKELLGELKQKWPNLAQCLGNDNLKKIAGLLIDTSPVASCDEAIIVVSDDDNVSSLINTKEMYIEHARFFNEFSKQPQVIYAINMKTWNTIKNSYVKKRVDNRLPQPRPILSSCVDMSILNEVIDQTSEIEKFAQEVFQEKLNKKGV